DRSARFRVTLGPVPYDYCEQLMPGGSKYPVLRRVVEQFTRGTLECEIDVLIEANETIGYQLGGRRGAILGMNTRLGGAGRATLMRVLMTDDPADARPILMEAS
ncbi:MAG TPA: type VI secretion system baseplate subunit TssG, partial [Polyangiaceae bacterium]|nr:type VI secretion system baseplate subunit TssG [Polyangiaceae bacterium]